MNEPLARLLQKNQRGFEGILGGGSGGGAPVGSRGNRAVPVPGGLVPRGGGSAGGVPLGLLITGGTGGGGPPVAIAGADLDDGSAGGPGPAGVLGLGCVGGRCSGGGTGGGVALTTGARGAVGPLNFDDCGGGGGGNRAGEDDWAPKVELGDLGMVEVGSRN